MYAFVYYMLFLLSVIVYIINRYEKALPGIDIFVCTADPVIEPPVMVINTVLSVMAYDYPPEKLNVYLSDDGGSDLTFYAMLEASRFCKIWLPFCKKFKVEPRSPEAYFRTAVEPLGEPVMAKEWSTVKVHLMLSCSPHLQNTIYCLMVQPSSFHMKTTKKKDFRVKILLFLWSYKLAL